CLASPRTPPEPRLQAPTRAILHASPSRTGSHPGGHTCARPSESIRSTTTSRISMRGGPTGSSPASPDARFVKLAEPLKRAPRKPTAVPKRAPSNQTPPSNSAPPKPATPSNRAPTNPAPSPNRALLNQVSSSNRAFMNTASPLKRASSNQALLSNSALSYQASPPNRTLLNPVCSLNLARLNQTCLSNRASVNQALPSNRAPPNSASPSKYTPMNQVSRWKRAWSAFSFGRRQPRKFASTRVAPVRSTWSRCQYSSVSSGLASSRSAFGRGSFKWAIKSRWAVIRTSYSSIASASALSARPEAPSASSAALVPREVSSSKIASGGSYRRRR